MSNQAAYPFCVVAQTILVMKKCVRVFEVSWGIIFQSGEQA